MVYPVKWVQDRTSVTSDSAGPGAEQTKEGEGQDLRAPHLQHRGCKGAKLGPCSDVVSAKQSIKLPLCKDSGDLRSIT